MCGVLGALHSLVHILLNRSLYFALKYKSYFVIIQLIMPIKATRFDIPQFNLLHGNFCSLGIP